MILQKNNLSRNSDSQSERCNVCVCQVGVVRMELVFVHSKRSLISPWLLRVQAALNVERVVFQLQISKIGKHGKPTGHRWHY